MDGQPASSSPNRDSRVRVLIIEDNALIALDLETQMEDLGCDVVGVAVTAAQAIDSLLWSFAPSSFVPHALLVGTEPCAERVSIAVATVPEWARDVLINLCPTAVEGFEPVARVNEIIIQEPSALQQARERFRHYQQAGARPEMIAL